MSCRFDVVILGAGAAGLFCAAEAGKRGRRVAVLESTERAGKKILISGGGRCNFTNIYCTPETFLSANPHFAKSALARFTPADFIALVEKYKIPYHEKTLGQLFCDHSAQEITGLLEAECTTGGVKIFLNAQVREVTKTTEFTVRTDSEEFRAPVLVVATGGLSIPKMGATAFGYDLAKQFGLKIQPTRPALVPLILGKQGQEQYCELAGVSAEVIASVDGAAFREKMLITHRGLRAGDFADFVVLAARQSHHAGPGTRTRSRAGSATGKISKFAGVGCGAAGQLAETLCGTLGGVA